MAKTTPLKGIPADTSLMSMPSDHQTMLWWKYVIGKDGADPDGWWMGHCPLHDPERSNTSAEFNFRKGVMRCWAESSCHPGHRVMSLGRVSAELLTR